MWCRRTSSRARAPWVSQPHAPMHTARLQTHAQTVTSSVFGGAAGDIERVSATLCVVPVTLGMTLCMHGGDIAWVCCLSSCPGSYCPAGSSSAAGVTCPAGKLCAGGSAGLTNCPAQPGEHCPEGSVSHSLCPVGAYCEGGSSEPAPCAVSAGRYCPAGTASPAGAPCPTGFFCPGGQVGSQPWWWREDDEEEDEGTDANEEEVDEDGQRWGRVRWCTRRVRHAGRRKSLLFLVLLARPSPPTPKPQTLKPTP